jgi:hypothetical protein
MDKSISEKRPLHELLSYTYATKHSSMGKFAIFTSSLSNNTEKGSFIILYSGIFEAEGERNSEFGIWNSEFFLVF